MPEETFESFMRRYGRPDGTYPVIEVGDTIEQWPTVVIKLGDKTAVIQFCGVGADGDDAHLSIDVHAFLAEQLARASVFGMENGRRYTASDDTTPGTSHGWPAVQAITVLIGRQTTRDHEGRRRRQGSTRSAQPGPRREAGCPDWDQLARLGRHLTGTRPTTNAPTSLHQRRRTRR